MLFVISLKPENVLIDEDGFALLTDFGLSKENMSGESQAVSLCGTPEYLAPEVLTSNRSYGKACDWWSFGVLLYEMITGVPPFYSRDRSQLFSSIASSEPVFPKYHPPVVKDLLQKLLVKDPSQRLADADEIMKHPFFAHVNWDIMMERQYETPYRPKVKDPTDTSHFDKSQTSVPVSSPPSADGSILMNPSNQEQGNISAATTDSKTSFTV